MFWNPRRVNFISSPILSLNALQVSFSPVQWLFRTLNIETVVILYNDKPGVILLLKKIAPKRKIPNQVNG